VAAIDHVYRYLEPSALVHAEAGAQLRLATSNEDAHPHFFDGRLTQPRLVGRLLRVLADLVGTRFYTPPNMLERILREADPVVTSGGGMLRFEIFSECCSTYARVDLGPGAYEAAHQSTGTTNVDFNPVMRAALAGLRQDDAVSLSVGREGLTLRRADDAIVEKKVRLPLRWLRGFVEVQGYQAAVEPAISLTRSAALRLLRSLPRQRTRHATWIVPTGESARASQRRSDGGVRVAGTERLRLLERLCASAETLRIYGRVDGTSSLWELDFGSARLTLLLSAEIWRGFSGEGQALSRLLHAEPEAIAAVRAQLAWQSRLDVEALAKATALEPEGVRDALAALGARGLVGFDAHEEAYFHRELPFDMSAVEALQPRLAAARKLAATGKLSLEQSGDELVATVPGSGVSHRVTLGPDDERCSCTWFSKTQGERGPCKHILAAQICSEQPS
jgi:SWIM zinc finger